MKRYIASLVYAVDRLMPRARVGGRESSVAYSLWEYRIGKDLLAAYAGRLGPLAGKLVLDVGCGLGGKTVAYAEAGARLVGVDIAEKNISQCAAFASARGVKVEFSAGDAEQMPFLDATFDLVIANDSLEHFRNPGGALRELGRVIKPGGSIFLFFTPWRSPLGSHLYDYIRTPWCHLMFPEWLIRELLVKTLAERGEEKPEARAVQLMDEYHTELNRITVGRYHEILRGIRSLECVYEELKPPKYARLAPFVKVPLAGEFFVGTVVGILSKRHSS